METAVEFLAAHRTVLEVLAFGLTMLCVGLFVGGRIGASRVQARDEVLKAREHVWRRRHSQAQRDARMQSARATREVRRSRARIRELQDAS